MLKIIRILLVLLLSVQLAAAANVSISGSSFQPGTINITSGNTVTWTNLDSIEHTVTDDTGIFDSGVLSSGQNFAFTFNTPGNFSYHCNIHSFMTGTVVVSGQISPVLATINVTPLTITLSSGSTNTFTAKGFDQDSNEINISRQVNWTVSDPAVGAIIPINITSGMFTALAAGTSTLTATSANVTGTATVNVVPADEPLLSAITVSPATISIAAGATTSFTAAPKDQNGNVMTGITVTWNSGNSSVGTISSTGVFFALANGTSTITATNGSVNGTATVIVGNGLPPEVARWDADHDGIIRKEEAITAVRAYFDETITKENAIAVVRAYFG